MALITHVGWPFEQPEHPGFGPASGRKAGLREGASSGGARLSGASSGGPRRSAGSRGPAVRLTAGGLGDVLGDMATVVASLERLSASFRIPEGMALEDGQLVNRGGHAPPGLNRLFRGQVADPDPDGTDSGTGPGSATETESATDAATATETATGTAEGANAAAHPMGATFMGFATGSTTSAATSTVSGATGTAAAETVLVAGTEATVLDLGALTINGATVYLGSVQGPYLTTTQARAFVRDAINAQSKSGVAASLDDQGGLVLTSRTGEPITIDHVGLSTTGNLDQLVDLGLKAGTYEATVTADTAILSDLFADVF